MSVRLSNDDCCAVDLLLEHAQPGMQGISPCFTTEPSGAIQQRLTRVEELLHTLDSHTVAEPAGDLVAKTLERCEQRAAVDGAPPIAPTESVATAR